MGISNSQGKSLRNGEKQREGNIGLQLNIVGTIDDLLDGEVGGMMGRDRGISVLVMFK